MEKRPFREIGQDGVVSGDYRYRICVAVKINRVSDKHKEEIILRQNLKQSFIDEYGYICMTCHGQGDWRGISLSHKVPLSRGGKTDRANCLNECYPCHVERHGIKEV